MSDTRNSILSPCRYCKRLTNHNIIHTVSPSLKSEDDQRIRYDTIQCLGCDCVYLKITEFSGDDEFSDVYPSPPKADRSAPNWMIFKTVFEDKDHKDLWSVLQETYSAHSHGYNFLTVMGIRCVLDRLMVDLVGDNGTFENNLNKMWEAGYISTIQKDLLTPIIDAGSAVIHRAYKPSPVDVGIILDVVESILTTIFHYPKRAELLGSRVPPRPKRKPKKKP